MERNVIYKKFTVGRYEKVAVNAIVEIEDAPYQVIQILEFETQGDWEKTEVTALVILL